MTINYKSLAARLRFLSSVCGLALLTVLSTTGVVAQVGPPNGTASVAGTALAGTTAYTFAQSSGTYTAITGGTVFQSGTSLNTDAVSAAVNIGFNFRYNNRTYSTVFISQNGFITFGANPPLATTTTGLSTNVNPAVEGAIAGFSANLRASAVTGAAPEIRYETIGSSPNRTFVVQYRDVGFSTTATTQRLNFQIRLDETTNVVRVVYGTTAWGTSTATGQVGLKGGESSDMANRTGTSWTAIAAGTGTTNTCTLGTTGGTTVPASGLTFTWTPGTTWGAASYATLPYLNDFATWSNVLNTGDSPGTSVRTWPSRGDNSWRASTNAVSGFTSTVGWASAGTTSQTATYSGAAVAPGARFHSYDCSGGSFGDMDFYLNMSGSPIGLYNVQFLYNNPSGADVIQVFYSGDAGATFTQLGSNIATAGNAWNSFSTNIAGTATSVIRVRGIGDFGADDINIDNFRVISLTCASPSALVYAPSSFTAGTLSWTNPTAGTPTNYEYEIRTSGAAGSGSTGLATSGSVANPSNSVVLAPGTLTANTAYSIYVRTDCGGGDLSGWSTALAIYTGYCTASGTSGSSQITNVTMNGSTTLNNTSAGNAGYGNFSAQSFNAVATQNVTWSISSTGGPGLAMWVDWNNDFVFATSERMYNSAAYVSSPTTGSFTVPSGTPIGSYRMRIVADWNAQNPVSCPSNINGETEDYTVTLIPACSGTPVIGAAAAASPTTLGCSGNVVNLTMDAGAQVGGGVSYQWASSSDGVTFSNIAGATGSTYTTPSAVINSTYYRGTATCSFSGLSNTTADYFVEAGFPTPTVAAVPAQFCGTGGTSALTGTVTGANPYDTFVWAVGAGQTGVLSNETSTTADWTVTESAGFTYTVTDIETGCVKSVSQSVNVLDGVTPNMVATPAVVCIGGTTNISSGLSAANFSSNTIVPAPTFGNPVGNKLVENGVLIVPQTSGSLDDGGWGNIPMGFTFNFFGTNYTTCNIGTNGNVMFGAYNGTALGDFTFTTLPSAAEPNPMIAILAMDNNFSGATGGTLWYGTYGFPGNRRFAVRYDNVQEFGDTKFSTATMVIYEATGIIEVYVTSTTNIDRVKVIGVNGPGGTIGALAYQSATIAQAGTWPATNNVNPISSPIAYRFTPPQNYTCSWTPSGLNGVTTPAGGTNLFSKPTNPLNVAGTTTFNLSLTNTQTTCVSNASINVIVANPPVTPTSTDVTAYGSSLGAGSAAVSPLTVCGVQNVTLNYVGSTTAADTIIWWNAATAGSRLGTGSSYTINSFAASTSVWVSINNGACPQTGRYEYVINYNTPPAVTVNSLGPDNDINCSATPTIFGMSYQLVSSNDPNYSYTWTNDGHANTFVNNGGGSATLTSDTTTASSWSAFDAVTGCIINSQKSFGVYSFPVIVPTANDTAICIGDSTIINSNLSVSNFTVKCVPFGFRTAPGNAVFLANNGVRNGDYGGTASLDDGGWAQVPIGFTFNYFGNDWTAINVGTNGVINFGPFAGFNASQYSFPSGFPSASSPVNTIGVLATDFYMTATGTVRFWTEGVAPNRVFVIEYNGPGLTADGVHVAQAHLFETLGLVEIHVQEATGTGTFAGPKTIGLQNGDGTIGATAPAFCNLDGTPNGTQTWNARNATITAAESKAWRFSPPVSYTFSWSPAAQISGPTNTASVVARPTTLTPGVQSYFVTATDNLSGCAGAPVELQFDVISPLVATSVVGYGLSSDVDGTNTIAFCGEQDVELYVSGVFDTTVTAKWYTQAVGGTGFSIAPNDTVLYGVAGPAGLTSDDSLWVSLDNGICEGPRSLVVLDYQAPDSLVVTNSNPVNCGPSTQTYTSNLGVSSAGSYTYTWSPSSVLNTTTGNAVTAEITLSTAITVTAVDATGFCETSETVSVSRYDFPNLAPTAANDSICPGGQTILNSNTSATSFTIQSVPFTLTSLPNAEVLVQNGVKPALPAGVTNPDTSLDDGYWVVPIGFTFNFLGNDYTQVAITTNGNLQFGPTISTSFTPAFGPATPNNFVALFWTDLNYAATNGSNFLGYTVQGVAPNRIFSVRMDACRFFEPTVRLTGQIDLYETTGIVRATIDEAKASPSPSASDVTIVGAENLDGTIGSAVPGRTSDTWTVLPTASETWQFNPPVAYTFTWLPANQIFQSNTLSSVVAQPSQTTQYQLIAVNDVTGCSNEFTQQSYVTVAIASAAPNVDFAADDVTVTTGGNQQTVTLTNSTPELGGETYVWTFTPNNVIFQGGTNANSRNPQVQFTEPGQFTVACTVTSCTGTATETKTNYITATASYCTPYFGDGFGGALEGCGDGDAVDDVVITNPNTGLIVMNHSNTGCTNNTAAGGSYTVYSPISGVTTTNLFQGSTYNMQVSSSNPAYTEFFGAWLDVDNDGDFNDPLEFLGGNTAAAVSATFEIGIPTSNVIYGPHKLRVMAAFGSGPLTANSACLNGLYGEAHDYTVNILAPIVANDVPAFATNLSYSANQNYPGSDPVNATVANATNSPETASGVIAGPDVWVRFVAAGNGVSITMTSTTMDDAIALYSLNTTTGAYDLIGSENVSSGLTDSERLNVGGLTQGTTYYVAFGTNGVSGGAFTYTIQHLLRSWPAFTQPGSGFQLCNTYKSVFRGNSSSNVQYTFNFTETGGTEVAPFETTSAVTTSTYVTLSNPALALQYGGVYNVKVDVLYNLRNTQNVLEPINIQGLFTDPNATGVTMGNHSLLEVRSTQRCPASLFRGTWLAGTRVGGGVAVCGVTNYTFEFQQVISCADGTTIGVPATFQTTGTSPYIQLGVLPTGINAGAWDVKIRPNFSYGAGVYGPVQRIRVNGTAAGTTIEEVTEIDAMRSDNEASANIYPNPNSGDMVNINLSGVEGAVAVRVIDATGRIVYTETYFVEGSLNTIATFAEPLAAGVYNIEFNSNGNVTTERMMVTRQ